MSKNFDLVVIGTGSAASTVALRCRSAGWRVAVVDSRPFGGTCALRGCDPKKVLVGAAEAIDWTRPNPSRSVPARPGDGRGSPSCPRVRDGLHLGDAPAPCLGIPCA